MSFVKRVLVIAIAAALVLVAASAIAAGEKPNMTTTANPNVRKAILGRSGEGAATEPPAHYDESIVKWIPIVVPLFAVMLSAMAYLIGAAVF